MRKKSLYVTLPVCLSIIAAGAYLANAGDLNPPPGPVQPTMKTLVEVEPRIAVNAENTPGDDGSVFKISQPGSYYLTGDITGEGAKNGILITAENVTLDLSGFAIVGVSGSVDGIGGGPRMAIINGTIRGWGGHGIAANTEGDSQFSQLVLANNKAGGLWCGRFSTVVDCLAYNNDGIGINVGSGSVVDRCIAKRNELDGISANADTTRAITEFR